MEKNEIEILDTKLKSLYGAEWMIIGRASNMIWLGFLKDDIDYALHVQSGFRVVQNGKILIADQDMYRPDPEVENDPDFNWDEFDWNVKGENCFDKWVKLFRSELRGGIVEKIHISDCGDLKISLSNNMVIEVVNNSSDDESWRFFQRNTDDHTVVYGNNIEVNQ